MPYQKIQKSCKLCGVDLGLVAPQKRFCDKCRKERIRKQQSESWYRLAEDPESKDYTPPSPCYTTPDGTDKRCPNFELCGAKYLACRSYFAYFHHETQARRFRDGRPLEYLGLPRIPNKGFYEASFFDDHNKARRRELVRILERMPTEFTSSDFAGVDSFLPGKARRGHLRSMMSAGIVRYLRGGLPYRKNRNVYHAHPVYGQPIFRNLFSVNPDGVERFIRGEFDGASPTGGRESADQASPKASLEPNQPANKECGCPGGL